jgi:hypothetical protein
MFTEKDGRVKVNYDYLNWCSDKRPPAIAKRGIYVLYRGTTPVYVGKGTAKKYGVFSRLKRHAGDWLHCH